MMEILKMGIMICAIVVLFILIAGLILVVIYDIKYGYNDDLIKNEMYEDEDFMNGYINEYPEGTNFNDIDKIELVDSPLNQTIDEWYSDGSPIDKDKIVNFNNGDE